MPQQPGAITGEAALEGGTTKVAVCRIFSINRSMLISFLAWIKWSAGRKEQERC